MLSDKIELYGAPQVRGERVFVDEKSHRVMEMIEDLPTLGPVTPACGSIMRRHRSTMRSPGSTFPSASREMAALS